MFINFFYVHSFYNKNIYLFLTNVYFFIRLDLKVTPYWEDIIFLYILIDVIFLNKYNIYIKVSKIQL